MLARIGLGLAVIAALTFGVLYASGMGWLGKDWSAGEVALIEDAWKTFSCDPGPAGCTVHFTDEEFAEGGRDAVYYTRAIEAPSMAVNAGGRRCITDEAGVCIETRPCTGVADDDDCLAETEERAWSSPIFVDFEATKQEVASASLEIPNR